MDALPWWIVSSLLFGFVIGELATILALANHQPMWDAIKVGAGTAGAVITLALAIVAIVAAARRKPDNPQPPPSSTPTSPSTTTP